ncbi:hypothetical protein DZC75_10515 [Pseudomonas parafulva]|uniref:Uncharacterized protein n=1 Tax=Pseudomonas parafulva TaxID=157782 RepID=A0AAI8PB85_9PSED|nr:hypothetical protein DZC75_10515 [Pseudomonas parafulva]
MGWRRKLVALRQRFTRRQRLVMGGTASVVAQVGSYSFPSQNWLYLMIFGIIVFTSAWSPEVHRKG